MLINTILWKIDFLLVEIQIDIFFFFFLGGVGGRLDVGE